MEVDGVPVRSLFYLKKDFSHLNNGSFGTIPREVNEARKRFLDEVEEEPDLWNRITIHRHFNEAADRIAATYNAPPEQVTFVANVTTGIECIVNSLNFAAGDSILVTNLTYGTLVWHAQWIAKKVGAVVHVLKVEFPYTHDSIVKQYEEALAKMEGKTKLAIIDHITCTMALRLPVERLIPLCAEHGVLSLIDGAHCPGQLLASEVDLSCLRPDFYAGNLHKWFFVPRGCAFLYVSQRFLDVVRPQVTSWLVAKSFRRRFAVLGTGDMTPVACVSTAFRFIEKLGGELAIRNFVAPLVTKGVELVTKALGTERVCEERFSAPHMITFYLGPEFDARVDLIKAVREQEFEASLYLFIRKKMKVTSNSIFVHDDRVIMRVTAQVFNTFEDFERLAASLLNLRAEIATMTAEEVLSLKGPSD